jgi:tetratricopeptide (TPR) repeat protein
MLSQSFGFWTLIIILASPGSAAQVDEPVSPPDAETACPQCRNDSVEIAQLHKTADRLYAQFKPKEAANELLKILRADPQNFEALIKLSRAYIDLGDMIPESAPDWKERRLKDYQTAEDYARRAIKANPNSTWGHFYLGASLGLTAVVSPVARQVELAEEIRAALEKSLALDPNNGFAYHAYGVWHRKISEIGKMSRVVASVLYGRSLPQGSMEKSVEYLKKAIALNPTVIISRLELASTYMAMEDFQAARTMLSSIRNLPIQFSDDAKHKQKAEELLEEVASR